MRRVLGIATGIVVQILFAVTSYYNYLFLQGSTPRTGDCALAWDAFLAIQFGVIHSLLLWPGVRKWLGRFISPAFYGLFFCTAACFTLLLTMCIREKIAIIGAGVKLKPIPRSITVSEGFSDGEEGKRGAGTVLAGPDWAAVEQRAEHCGLL
jgi:hypothetical protein